MPDKITILRWLRKFPEFSSQYAQARDALTDHWAEEIVEISDDSSNDWVERERENGSSFTAVDHENINRSRLRVDTRKWLMARMAPKKYSERLETNSSIDVRLTLAELVKLSYKDDLPELPAPKIIENESE